jgi:hypothetical protein
MLLILSLVAYLVAGISVLYVCTHKAHPSCFVPIRGIEKCAFCVLWLPLFVMALFAEYVFHVNQ